MKEAFLDDLINLLCRIPALQNQDNRTTLLRSLPRDPVSTISRHPALKPDLTQIVQDATEWGQISTEGKWALDIIMDNASPFVEDTTLGRELNALKREFQRFTQIKQITIRVVVIAMTREEAEGLDSETIFDNSMVPSGERKYLRKLKAALRKYNREGFISCYKESRDEWKPLMADQTSIQEIIQDVVDKLNKDHEKRPGKPSIRVEYLSDNFLSSKSEDRHRVWDTLEKHGGILIVDAISMYHPLLRKVFLNSELIGSKNPIAMILISPLKPKALKVNELLENEIYTLHMERAFDYFANHLDPFYEFGVGDIHNLRRWLFSTLPTISRGGLSPERRDAIRTERNQFPQGIGDFVTGEVW